jgi:hypothetical protein
MTAGEGPADAVADRDWAGVWAAFTEGVDMGKTYLARLEKTKSRASRAALIGTRQRSVIAAARAGEHCGVAC